MDRYVLAVLVNLGPKRESSFNGVAACKTLFDHLKGSSSTSNYSMPACSLTGRAAPQRWYFAFQASYITTQWCSPEWEDLCPQHSESKESHPSYIESCIAVILEQEEQSMLAENPSELFEEAAEGLHQLADKLPPPGKALLDVIMVCVDEEVGLKEMLPLIGSLKHLQSWFSANMVIVTDLIAGWKKVAAYLGASFCLPPVIESCVNKAEIWRGGLQIKEKKFVSELMFDGFCLQTQSQSRLSNLLYPQMDNQGHTEHKRQNEVFQCYQPVLELIQLVRVPDLQILLLSSTEFHLGVTSQSVKAKLLLDQLCTLRGEVGALFSLACIISSESFPAAPQLSSCKWRDLMSKHPKDLLAPDVEVKGERGQYLFLVQGTESGGCSARMIHTASQLNGSAALATLGALVTDKLNSGSSAADWPGSLPYLSGEQLVQRERRLAKVQTLVLKECSRRRVEAHKPYAVPVTELKALLSLARAQYLQMHDSTLPTASQSLAQTSAAKLRPKNDSWHAEWPERSVLLNYQNIQRVRQKSRCRLFSSGSSESLMGPKDGHRGSATLLDARELLKHFTSDGRPSGELQSLPLLRGENAFRLSPDLTPRKVSGLSFRKASRSHYHGIEFCLDEHKALERDRSFVKLQSRLIRYETQSTCCKEPCPVPFALSPVPSPAVLSEPGSVPDGEALQSEPPRLTRRSHKPDVLVQQRKRSCKSESGEALAGAGRLAALRQEASGSVTDSSPSHKPSQDPAESRSQKHNRMLREVVVKTLDKHRISSEHTCFEACSKRLFDISKFYLKDLKTSRGLHEEMKKAASNNVKQVIEWVLEKSSKR